MYTSVEGTITLLIQGLEIKSYSILLEERTLKDLEIFQELLLNLNFSRIFNITECDMCPETSCAYLYYAPDVLSKYPSWRAVRGSPASRSSRTARRTGT